MATFGEWEARGLESETLNLSAVSTVDSILSFEYVLWTQFEFSGKLVGMNNPSQWIFFPYDSFKPWVHLQPK